VSLTAGISSYASFTVRTEGMPANVALPAQLNGAPGGMTVNNGIIFISPATNNGTLRIHLNGNYGNTT